MTDRQDTERARGAANTALVRRLSNLTAPQLSPRARSVAKVIGLAVLLGASAWSIRQLNLSPKDVLLGPLLVNLLLLSPANLILAAITLQITARSLGTNMAQRTALQAVVNASLAELLPLPGGAIVRTSALVNAGSGVGASTAMVTLTALLTLAMATTAGAVALILLGLPEAVFFVVAGGAGAAVSLVAVARLSSHRMLFRMTAVRLGTIALSTLRLVTSFAAISAPVPIVQALLFSVATTFGSAVAIVPGGFGVNEAVAAGLAKIISSSAAAAFLAVALSRALTLCAAAMLAVGLLATKPPRRSN